jgi:glycosyltransferase involved in cell wall biosynthesis
VGSSPERAETAGTLRVLLVDPSSRGGIVAYTMLVARALRLAGAAPEILASASLTTAGTQIPLAPLLPSDRWGKPRRAGPGFYARRLITWVDSARLIARQVRRRKPDLIHFQAQLNRRFDAHLLRRLRRRAPVVWTAHDVLPFERSERDPGWFASIYRSVDRVVVHTQAAAEELRSLAGVDAVVIEHPAPDDVVRLPRAEARRRLELPGRGRVLAALGFIRPYKGYQLLADVWERLGAAAPLLLVMGEMLADEERAVIERIERCSRTEVRLGYVSDTELQTAISAADALLLPYVLASESGLLHLARALGVPVIASDAAQLAASVAALSAGAVVPRDLDAWSAAVSGELPPPPPRPPTLESVGAAHLALYRELLQARGRSVSARPLRLAVYTDSTEIGGAERSLATLIAALRPGIDLTVVGVDQEVVAEIAAARPGCSTLVLPPVRNKFHLGPILAHLRALRRLEADVFQANLRHPWSCQYGIAAALRARGTRVIAVEHLPVPPSGWLQRRLKRATSRRLAAHVSVGLRSARTLESLIGLAAGSIRTIHNGIAEAEIGAVERPFPGPTIVAVGRLSRQKGFDLLLRALASLPGVSLVLIGDGPRRGELERLAGELGLSERLLMTGWADDVRPYLRAAEVLALPSRWESFPLVVLEAMFAGLPVVAADVGSVKEAVLEGETGLVVPTENVEALAEALARLLDDPGLRAAMGRRAAEVAHERFNAGRMAEAFESLYAEVSS